MSEPRDYRPTVFLPKTEFPMKAGLPEKEPGILARWQQDGLYEQVRKSRAGREKFILHDGPPYANGDIHIGHALNHILKDMVVRTQTLLGKDAPYVPGWDCHGLPIEWKVEEQYRKRKQSKDEVPAKEFRAECRAYAQHWVDTQREQLKRLGIGGDWDHPYLTMDFAAEAAIVGELLKFAEAGLLYRGSKPVMWSPVEKTALAEAEVEYEDIVSTQVDVAFEIVEAPEVPKLVGAYAVIWTTTPWTIPVNQAIAFHPTLEQIDYEVCYGVFKGTDGRRYVLSQALAGDFAARSGIELELETALSDDALKGAVARHPMHKLGGFFAKPRPFLPGDFVTTDSGTGLVHMAPDHGEDDFILCKSHGIDPVFAVEADGKYREDWAWLGGQESVINGKFNAPDGPICEDLKLAGGLLSASTDYPHSYPHSWRSKAKVIYRCTPQWFVPMDRPLESFEFPVAPASGIEGAIAMAVAADSGTLRDVALGAIAQTRFAPDKGRNRIGSMVETRPDWVLSRQRAWGVPITLFVERKTGEYLVDPEVNDRIVAAVRESGVDAWDEGNAQALLGTRYTLADYERIGDILDVWFDSGSTHAFVLESGRWPDLSWPADLYLEGSDQHRGWFQSSLLESCATRGRAPYNAVLTHGFTMASDGKKMSKSLGNTVDPIKVMQQYGADIIRLWALSVDYTEDHRIGDEILKGVADQYRKLRNTFRYLLGALHDFDKAERVEVSAMPELEQYVLALLHDLDNRLRAATANFDFNAYTRALSDFANEDLSAFFFDIRKDCLYCDAPTDPRRRAYRTVLDTMFHALVRYAAPVLVYTAEEVWLGRYPGSGSVHLLEWPELPDAHADMLVWSHVRELREKVTEAIEPLRRDKIVGSSLEAVVKIRTKDAQLAERTQAFDLTELCIAAQVDAGGFTDDTVANVTEISVTKTTNHKCGRCWRHLPEVTQDGALCSRCDNVVASMDAPA